MQISGSGQDAAITHRAALIPMTMVSESGFHGKQVNRMISSCSLTSLHTLRKKLQICYR